MAISQSTVANAGGAVSDLFAGFAAATTGDMKAKGLNLNAESLRLKAQGDLAEGQEYDLASALASKNAEFTDTSTRIQQMQQDRSTTMQIGGQQAAIAGAGGAASGSSLDVLADSARQGALAKAVLGQQGLISEAGYQEQAQSYNLMSSTARTTAAGEQDIATKTDQLAEETRQAAKTAETGDFISGAIKGAAAIASVGLAPFTGGLSLAALPALGAIGGDGGGK